MPARGSDISSVPRIVVSKQIICGREGARVDAENHHSLTFSLQLTQEEVGQVRGELKDKDSLMESLRKAARAEKSSRRGQKKGPGGVKKHRPCHTCVHKCFYSFSSAVYDETMDFEELEPPELCFD